MALGKLGFGCMRFPVRSSDPKDIDFDQLDKMFDLFLENGFTYVDTSYVYHAGASEKAVKRCLVDRHPRDQFTVATKLPTFALSSEDQVETTFQTQLKNVGVEYFDYYLLHNLNRVIYDGLDGRGGPVKKFHMFEHAREWKEKGLIRNLGFSFHDDPEMLDRILSEHPEVDFVQIVFNYFDYDSPFVQSKNCYDVIQKHGCKAVFMEPVKGGTLADAPAEAKRKMQKMHPDQSIASWAIRFAASQQNIIAVLSGMSTLEQMRDNISYMKDFQPITPEEESVLKEASVELRTSGPVQIPHAEELKNIRIAGVPAYNIVDAYNSCQIQPDPYFACELNYLKGQLAKTGRDVHENLGETRVILSDGTDVTETVMKCLHWLQEHSF